MAAPFYKPVVCPVLIDRVSDLATLHALITEAKSGRGQVALLSGEAGVGKSRLVAETKAYAAAQDFLLLQGNCFQADLSSPYAPLIDLLQSSAAAQLAATISSDQAPFRPELYQVVPDILPLPSKEVLPSSLDLEQEKRRLFTSLAHFFTGQAVKQPVLLIIEDMHWSDDTSMDFLLYLAQLDRERLALEISLARLTRDEVEAMLRAIFALPRSARLELLDPIYALTEGNPFFIEEILKSLMTAGDIFYVNGRWDRKELRELHIPRSVRDAVQQRTDGLSEDARRVLTNWWSKSQRSSLPSAMR